jgi:LuxR family quorum sensing-dependent transcriptional regulator
MRKELHFNFDSASQAIERIKLVSCENDFIETFAAIIGDIGYRYFVISGIPGPYDQLDKFIVAKRLPESWERFYFSNNFFEIDPIVERCVGSAIPFRWSEVKSCLAKDDASLAVMVAAEKHGLTNGICIPIHGVNGYEAGVSLSGNSSEISNENLKNIHMFCLYSFNALKTLARDSIIGVSNLTKREKEALSWAALGKTNKEIAQLLFLSEETVSSHIKSSMKKLSAQNKAEAVATALRARIIPG